MISSKKIDKKSEALICIVSPLDYTGIAYYTHSLCQSLEEIGLNVELLTVKKPFITPNKVSYKIFKIFSGTYGTKPRALKGIAYLISLVKVYLHIHINKITYVHFQILDLPELDYLLFLVLKISNKKIIFTPHDIASFKDNRKNKYLKKMYKLSDCIIVHNEENRSFLMREYGFLGDKIAVIKHGNYNYFITNLKSRDLARVKLGLPTDKKILLFFGNLREGKGIETLLKSIKFIDAQINFLLLIIGKQARNFYIEEIKKTIIDDKLSNRIKLVNKFVDDSLVEEYYKSADIVVIPYEKIYESGVLRYAFSCGIPVVVSDIKVFSEFAVNGENCIIFKVGDSKDLSDKITMLLQNEVLSKQIAINAKKLSDQEWSWQKSAVGTKKIYDCL